MTSFHYALSETEVCQAIVQLAVTFLRSGALTPSTVVRPMGLKVKRQSIAALRVSVFFWAWREITMLNVGTKLKNGNKEGFYLVPS